MVTVPPPEPESSPESAPEPELPPLEEDDALSAVPPSCPALGVPFELEHPGAKPAPTTRAASAANVDLIVASLTLTLAMMARGQA